MIIFNQKMSARDVFIGFVVAAMGGLALWFLLRPSDACGQDRTKCPAVLGVPEGYSLWLTAGEPRPGSIYRVKRTGDYGSVEPISDYLAEKRPAPNQHKTLDRAFTLNDALAIAAAAKIFSTSSNASASITKAESLSFSSENVTYTATPSRSEFLTWLQAMDSKPKYDEDGRNLFHELQVRLAPTDQEDASDGSLYVITQVQRAGAIKFETSDRERDRVGLACESDNSCAHVGRNSGSTTRLGTHSESGTGDTLPFMVQMRRIGSASNNTLRYDGQRPGPKVIGL